MKKKNYYKCKVFDCQDMPDDLTREFLYRYERCNDVYVDYVCHENEDEEPDIIDTWLLENGAKSGEEVLIKYWW